MNKKIISCATICLLLLSCLSGCGKKKAEDPTEDYSINLGDNSMIDDASSDVPLMKDGKIQSDLNGDWVTPSDAEKRYVGIMVVNNNLGLPQSGVEKADVVYEILEEGGISRLLCLFSQDVLAKTDKIGPVRSTRVNFDRKALEHDAVLVHWGGIWAMKEMPLITDLDDMNLNTESAAYGFRVDRPGYGSEFTGYTSGEKILQGMQDKGFDFNKCKEYKSMFSFNMEDTDLEKGDTANKISMLSNIESKPYFEYDSSTGKYLKFTYGDKQIDEVTGNQIAFENVIYEFAPHLVLSDEVASKFIDDVGEGAGLYATNGKIIPIKWKKDAKAKLAYGEEIFGQDTVRDKPCSDYGVTKFYTEDGKELKLNPGKTYITLFPDSDKGDIVYE
ncbi:MAG: DUF3048 domain-containing protein [Eubacterium sp.]|nr:DUF3048 domain-containing protein [Eubacterium sp.]